MAYKRTIKVLKGKKMYATNFGRAGMASGMYSGGFERYLFGIKYIFGIEYVRSWGSWMREF